MYRKYYNSSYYTAKTQDNSPERIDSGQYLNQPLIDQTNQQSNLQSNVKSQKNSKTTGINQSINLQSLLQNQILLLQQPQNNQAGSQDQNQSFVQNSIGKRYNSSQKRVKTQNNTPEKLNGGLRQQSFNKNIMMIPQKNDQPVKGNHSFINASNLINAEINKQISQQQMQHFRARSNSSMVVQKMNIQKPTDTLKSHKSGSSKQIEEYTTLNKLILNTNNPVYSSNKFYDDNKSNQGNNNQTIRNKQQQGDQIRSQSYNNNQNIINNNKTISSVSTENDTDNTNQKLNDEDIKKTLEKEAAYYLQDRLIDKGRKNTQPMIDQVKPRIIDESQYTFDRIMLNNNKDEQQQIQNRQKVIPSTIQSSINRVSESQFNSIKNKIIQQQKNNDNNQFIRQTNSALSNQEISNLDEKTIEPFKNKQMTFIKGNPRNAQFNNYLDNHNIISQNQSKDKIRMQNTPITSSTKYSSQEDSNTLTTSINNYASDYNNISNIKRTASPFDRRPIKRASQSQNKRTVNSNSLNTSINNERMHSEYADITQMRTQINGQQFNQNQNDININQNQDGKSNQSKEKLKKMQLNFLNQNDNPLNNIVNLLKKNKQVASKINSNNNSINESGSNLLKAAALHQQNQQGNNNSLNRIQKRSQSFANGSSFINNKPTRSNYRSNVTPEQTRISQFQSTHNTYRGGINNSAQTIDATSDNFNFDYQKQQQTQPSQSQQQTIGIQKIRKMDITHSFRTKKGVMASNPKKQNQDSFFLNQLTENNNNEYDQVYFLGVMDGHGSLGHFVSQFIKNNIVNEYNLQNEVQNYEEKLLNLTDSLNFKLAESSIDCMFSGTTMISLLLLFKNDSLRIFSCNCGDSRAIMGLLKSSTTTIQQQQQGQQSSNKQNQTINSYFFEVLELSRDHKPELPDEKERIIANNGRIESYRDEFGNQLGPMRVWLKNENIPGLAMSRSIGDDVATSVGVTWEPEIKEFNILFTPLNQLNNQQRQSLINPNNNNNDENNTKKDNTNIIADSGFIVIGSDGVWEFLPNEHIIREIGKYYILKDIEGACNWLLNEAYNKWTSEDNSVVDDITFIILFLQPKEILQRTLTANKRASQSLETD